MNHLVIGNGEIGKALQYIFGCQVKDLDNTVFGQFDCLHIAFPYSRKFKQAVLAYKKQYKAKHVIIHSTVPVGTCAALKAVHSPVIGVHPYLAKSILTFQKFVTNLELAHELRSYKIPAVYVKNSKNTEAGKLFSLLIYGINILLEKEVFDYCKKNKLDFNIVYREFVSTYNRGYRDLNMPYYQMFTLSHHKGKIGGHCVVQNAPRLGTFFAKTLKRLNAKLK